MPLHFKTSCSNLKNRGLGAKFCVALLYFNFEWNYDFLKSNSHCFLLSENVSFDEKRNGIKNSKPNTTLFETGTLYFNSFKNHQSKKIPIGWGSKTIYFHSYDKNFYFWS